MTRPDLLSATPQAESRQRRRILRMLAASGLSASNALQFALAQQSQSAQGMRQARGDVRVNNNSAAEGTRVQPGDTVSTGADGIAMFTVGGDAYLLRPNSTVQLAGSGLFPNLMRVLTGKLMGVFATGSPRQLASTTATIGIRGTGAYMEAEPERTYFCLCYGSAEVQAAGSSARDEYSTTHHESPRYIYADGRSGAIVPASVINHTDAELIMLESLVDRTPPRAFMESTNRY